jgi:hypothetical protein
MSVVHGAGALNANDQFCGMMNSDADLNEFRENVRWGFFRMRDRGDKRLSVRRVRVHGMMLYMHIYYCALRGLRAARFCDSRAPAMRSCFFC